MSKMSLKDSRLIEKLYFRYKELKNYVDFINLHDKAVDVRRNHMHKIIEQQKAEGTWLTDTETDKIINDAISEFEEESKTIDYNAKTNFTITLDVNIPTYLKEYKGTLLSDEDFKKEVQQLLSEYLAGCYEDNVANIKNIHIINNDNTI